MLPYITKDARCSLSKFPVPTEMPRMLALPFTSEINVSLFMAISHSFAKPEIFISQIYNSVLFIFHYIYLMQNSREKKQFKIIFSELMKYWIIWLIQFSEAEKGEERKLWIGKGIEEQNSNQEE